MSWTFQNRLDRFPAWCVILAVAFPAQAQTKKPLTIDLPTLIGFEAPIRDETGREVARVTGDTAKPSIAGQVEITGFKLESYRYDPDRRTEVVVESPGGTFSPQGASSDKSLTLRGAGDLFVITGTGWSWTPATGGLVVSNAVRTSIRRTQEPTNRPPIEIHAARFEYSLKTGEARFSGDCVAEDPGQARVSAGELASRLSPRETQPQAIFATHGVVIELLRKEREGRATGDSAQYSSTPAGERIELKGSPTWSFGPGTGSADELLLMPGEESYIARGHARLKLVPSRSASKRGGDPDDAANEKAARTAPESQGHRIPVEIECDTIEGGRDEVVFQGPVTARQADRLALTSRRLVASLAPDPTTRQPTLTRATATGEVKASIGAGSEAVELGGDEMEYSTGEHPLIEVKGSPSWHGADHRGFAGLILIHPDVPSFEALEGVRVSWRSAAASTNAPPVDLRAARMVLQGEQAEFTGGVTAVSGPWDVQGAELQLRLSTNRTLREIAVRRDVVMNYRLSPPGPESEVALPPTASKVLALATGEALQWRISGGELIAELDQKSGEPTALEVSGGVKIRNLAVEADGGRMTYGAADGLLRLVDDARLKTPDGVEIIGEAGTALTVDPRSARFGVEGPVRRMVFPVRALRAAASTNSPSR